MRIVITYDDNGEYKAHVEGASGAACQPVDLDLLGGETLEEGWTPEHDHQQERRIMTTERVKAKR